MRSYWALVWYDANAAAWKWVVGHIGAAMITVGCIAFGLAGLWGWGSAEGLKDQFIMVGAAALAMGLTYAGILAWQLLTLPPRLHAEQGQKIATSEQQIASLNDATTPRLSFELDPEQSRWTYNQPGYMDCYASVRNGSTTKTIEQNSA